MIDGSSLDLAFEFESYRGTLDKKAKKDNKQFTDRFVEETKKGLKSSKQSGSTNE